MPWRRRFLQQASATALAWSANARFGRWLSAQTRSSTASAVQIFIDSRRSIATLDRNLFGSFLEHLGRAIYQGIKVFMIPGQSCRTQTVSAKTCLRRFATSLFPSFVIPAGILFPAITGWTVWVRSRTARGCWTRLGLYFLCPHAICLAFIQGTARPHRPHHHHHHHHWSGPLPWPMPPGRRQRCPRHQSL
jgi:hypothetical protein